MIQSFFANFVQNVLGVPTPWAQNTIIVFVSTFTDLLSATDEEINSFVTTTHSSNSSRAANAKI